MSNIEISILANVTGGAGAKVSPHELQNALLDPYKLAGKLLGRPIVQRTIESVIRPK